MTVTLAIQPRAKTKKINKAELLTVIPGVVYGPKHAAEMVVVERKTFEKLFKTAGESTVITLTGLAKSVDVLVKDVSFSALKGGVVHVDFYALEKGKEISTHVPLHFTGEAEAVKAGAVVNKVLHEVNILCQAQDLPAHIDVDLALLKVAGDRITIGDITVPKGVKITDEKDDVVAIADIVAEEVESENAPMDIADIPVEKKGKEEAAA